MFVAESDVGVLVGSGNDRVDFLHRLSTNDLRPLGNAGETLSTVFTSDKGRILDWAWLYAREADVVIRTSPGRAEALAAWLDKYTIMEDFRTRDESAAWSLVTVQTPSDAQSLLGPSLPAPGRFEHAHDGLLAHAPQAFGERYELLLPKAAARAFLEAAQAKGARLLSSDELERLRIEAGVPSPLHEFKDEVNPLELRINAGVISWTKGCYIGQEVIARLDSYDKLARQLMGFRMQGAVTPSDDARIVKDGKLLGRVTSFITHAGETLGLAVVKREAALPGNAELRDGEVLTPLLLEDRPFWRAL